MTPDSTADLVVIGSSPVAELVRLIGDSRAKVESWLGCSLADEQIMRRQMDAALALRALAPRLHLPALAGLAEGPGFANLSCLGSLSDCILSAYVSSSRIMQKNATGAVLR